MPIHPESFPIPNSPMGDALAGSAAVGALAYFALKTRVSHHAQKAAERQNRGVISPVIYIPIGHRGIAERLHNPIYEEDGTPKILMPGRNWIPRNSAVIVSVQDNRYRIIHKGIQNEHKGQLYSETTVGWHVGEDAQQLFRSHYNFKNEKSLALQGADGETVKVTPLDLAAVGIIASGLRKVLQQTSIPFDISDASVKSSLNRRISRKLDTVCGSVLSDVSVEDIGYSNGQMGITAFQQIGGSALQDAVKGGVVLNLPENWWNLVPAQRGAFDMESATA